MLNVTRQVVNLCCGTAGVRHDQLIKLRPIGPGRLCAATFVVRVNRDRMAAISGSSLRSGGKGRDVYAVKVLRSND